jgi:tRNA A-37 threonylcarbamoyl transferase component Bud32
MVISTCPPDEDLRRILVGELCPEAAELEQHLLGCPRCLKRIESMSDVDFLVEVMRAASENTPAKAPDSLAAQLQRLSETNLSPPTLDGKGLAHLRWQSLNNDTPSSYVPLTPVLNPQTEQSGSYPYLAPPQQPDEIGRLGGYRVLEVIGAGGMGVVFRAEDPQLKRQVALKVIKPAHAGDSQVRERFLREAQAAAAVEHQNIVAIYQIGSDGKLPFLAMPLLKGESLQARIDREKHLPLSEVVRIGREIAEGLAAAHERGLIHRDIKPSNIWLEAPSSPLAPPGRGVGVGGEGFRVKVLDFGLARVEEGLNRMTEAGTVLGTPAYMAPEQAAGKAVDARADLFSLGVILYELSTGEVPFDGPHSLAVMLAVSTLDPVPPRERNAKVPEPLSELVMRLLNKSRDDRPASAREVIEALQTLQEGPKQTPPSQPAVTKKYPEPVGKRRAGKRALVLVLGLVLVGALVAGALVWWQPPPLQGPEIPGEPRRDFKLEVNLVGAKEGPGEVQMIEAGVPFQIRIVVDQEAYVRVYNLRPDDRGAVRLLPNKWEEKALVLPSESREFPGKGKRAWSLKMTPTEPGRFEMLRVIAANRPIKDPSENLAESGYRVFDPDQGKLLCQRGLPRDVDVVEMPNGDDDLLVSEVEIRLRVVKRGEGSWSWKLPVFSGPGVVVHR